MTGTVRSPAAAFARPTAAPAAATNENAPPRCGRSGRVSCVTTNVGAGQGTSSQCARPTSNVRLPTTTAPLAACTPSVTARPGGVGSVNIQSCNRSPPAPGGSPAQMSGPATQPSSDMLA
jgi:hypothetical protein